MWQTLRAGRFVIALLSAAIGSTVMYYNHMTRAVGDGDLCRRVEKHVVKLNTDTNGAVVSDSEGFVDNIRDLCDRALSRRQAECVLKATSNAQVRACL